MKSKLLSKIKSSFAVTLMIFFLLYGCRAPYRTQPIQTRQISCDIIYPHFTEDDYSICLERANAGDAKAAFAFGKLYDGPFFGYRGLKIKPDDKVAFYWYKKSADLGHKEALKTVFESYYFGKHVPENKLEANLYLKRAAELGHQWAMLLLAHQSKKEDPEKAIKLYKELALMDNCHAQRKLSTIYFEGILVPQDICKSYFWALLASVGDFNRRSEYHFMASDSLGLTSDEFLSGHCSTSREKSKAEKELGLQYTQMVQDAASKWKVGQQEPDFPIVQIAKKDKPVISKISPPDTLDLSKPIDKEKSLKWIPIKIEKYKQATSETTSSELFNFINKSVWTVFSASSAVNLKAMNNISLASGVAISESKLLTNYHVIEDRPYVIIKHGDRFENAVIFSGDRQTDRCILTVEKIKLKPVHGFRKYESLDVGETVYSVGSPKGLENTLGQGIISGKRELNGLKLIQTTAQISKGSSGGGLFDRFGNLIGITTFKLADSEGLNFAISIDNFTQ